jgi:uncharacterized protein (TIGR04255 family)
MTKLPRRLGKAPLVEVIFELRFTTKKESAGDLLPGMLYAKLGEYYENVKPLPLASVPREIRNRDANLRYGPSHQLIGPQRKLQVGDSVALISEDRSYQDWEVFRKYVHQFVEALQATNIVEKVLRYSLKYVNVIPAPTGQQLSLLNAKFELAERTAPEKGFQFRTEFETDPWVTITHLVTNAEVKNPSGESLSGLLVEVDTIRLKSPEDLFSNLSSRIDEAHATLKPFFFDLLTPQTLKDLDPKWEEN